MGASAQQHDVPPFEPGVHFLDAIQIDNRGSVCAEKVLRIESRFQLG
jgi:hypothetical protein